MKGGKRPGAGRPAGVTRKKLSLTVRLDQVQHLRALGGSRWLQSAIDLACAKSIDAAMVGKKEENRNEQRRNTI